MLKNDRWIIEQAKQGMIAPFESSVIREVCDKGQMGFWRKTISYGTGSYGYDLRLAPHDFRIFRHCPGKIVNPKQFNPEHLESAELFSDVDGDYFIIPANSYGLGVAIERLEIPKNISVVCVGKSTYARCGIIANVTPAEAGWKGHLRLEFSNASNADCRIFANEGCLQLLFFEGEPCEVTYDDRNGKYQNQNFEVTLPLA